MKITIVQGAFFPIPPILGGAVEKVWFRLAKQFAAEGHDILHISRKYADLPEHEIIDGVRHLRINGFDAPHDRLRLAVYDLAYSLRVMRRLPVADIIVTNTIFLPILLRSSRWGAAYVHMARYPKPHTRLYKHAARLQTVSSPIARAIGEIVPDSQSKTVVIPYPIDTYPLQENNHERRATSRTMLYVGRVHPEKGIDLLLRAFAGFTCAVGDRWKLRVVGPWQAELGGGGEIYRNRLLAVAKECNCEVEWIGPIFDETQLLAYLDDCFLFLYPSVSEVGETFGLAVLEAMARGCAAVVSDLECFKDFIANDMTGYIFDHRAHNAAERLRDRLLEVVASKAHDRVRNAAYEVAKGLTVTKIAKMYLADFEEVLSQDRPRAFAHPQ